MYGLNPETADAAPVAPEPAFGADLTVGYAAGVLVAEWPDPGVSGAGTISLGLYPSPAGQAGSRVGGLFWTRFAAWPVPSRTESCDTGTSCAQDSFRFLHFGLDLSFRSDPGARWGGGLDFGFSDLVVEDYYGAPLAIPMFSVRPGTRHPLGPVYLEAAVRAGVGTQRTIETTVEEWWSVSAELGIGLHVR